MALKKRTVVSPAAGAVTLPTLMAELPGTRRLEELPLDKLSPAPTEWNFYAPLPDDKLLELIESIQTNELLHPIVVWKQPDGALMILSGHNRVRAYTALLEKTGEDKYRRIPATVLTDITADEAERLADEGQFGKGSMEPKVRAAIKFARSRKGRTCIIGALDKAAETMACLLYTSDAADE